MSYLGFIFSLYIIITCSALLAVREMLVLFTTSYSTNLSPLLRDLLVQSCSPSNPELCDFLLDCTALPTVISMAQCLWQDIYLHLFNVTRMWVYALHRECLKLKGEWKDSTVWVKVRANTTNLFELSQFYSLMLK